MLTLLTCIGLQLCIGCGGSSKTDEEILMGTYARDKFVLNNIADSLAVDSTTGWVFMLLKNNNFQIYGSNKNIVGYWKVESMQNGEYTILLSSGNLVTYIRATGNLVYFDDTNKWLNNLFKRVVFVRVNK